MWIAVTASLPLLWGCGVDRGSGKVAAAAAVSDAEDVSRDTFALGTAVTRRGAVPENATGETFVRGGEVFLSVDLNGASTDPVVEVKWLDPTGAVLHRDVRHARHGAHHLPFSSGATSQWRPGPHRAVVLIDGRSVSEKRFTVM